MLSRSKHFRFVSPMTTFVRPQAALPVLPHSEGCSTNSSTSVALNENLLFMAKLCWSFKSK